GSWRSHQVPLSGVRDSDEHLAQLDAWLRSYRPEEPFDEHGTLVPEVAAADPTGELRMSPHPATNGRSLLAPLRLPVIPPPPDALRMSARPATNGGSVLAPLRLPDIRDYAVEIPGPGGATAEATKVLGTWLRDVVRDNPDNFRIFGPDETASNRLQSVYEATDKQWNAQLEEHDRSEHLARAGRVMEVLSEHQCQGWLEGYLLTGRHGLFSSYEAFIHIVDSMVNQHAKWLKVTNELEWRRPLASLNY